MSKENFALLNEWLLSLNLQNKKEALLEDIHVDELIGKQDSKIMLHRSLELFYDLIRLDFGFDLYAHYIPALALGLGWSNKLSYGIGKDIWKELDAGDPPNIYLLPKDYRSDMAETYSKPLYFKLFTLFQGNCIVYYCCRRNIEALQKGQHEYHRDIWIKSFKKIG